MIKGESKVTVMQFTKYYWKYHMQKPKSEDIFTHELTDNKGQLCRREGTIAVRHCSLILNFLGLSVWDGIFL